MKNFLLLTAVACLFATGCSTVNGGRIGRAGCHIYSGAEDKNHFHDECGDPHDGFIFYRACVIEF